ncbi:hypothetical protein H6P81_008891 [Aristolochia fimbriata]|uniref:Uncharacterized protein n=1 Tax=Aristolochia fimbriata TaxID=158543 RepID=A0AAV7EKJ9_ARIFI|nr:hypothetical protein H6P81_008891 [Aristolochia fimbriata]
MEKRWNTGTTFPEKTDAAAVASAREGERQRERGRGREGSYRERVSSKNRFTNVKLGSNTFFSHAAANISEFDAITALNASVASIRCKSHPDNTLRRCIFCICRSANSQLIEHAQVQHLVDPAAEVLEQNRHRDVHPEEAAVVPQLPGGVVLVGGDERVYERVGAADKDGETAARGDFLNGGVGEGTEVEGGELAVCRIEFAEEVVRNAAAVRNGDFVGGDVEALVELYLVGINDLGGEATGYVDGETRFSGAGGPNDDDELVLAIHPGPPSALAILSSKNQSEGVNSVAADA